MPSELRKDPVSQRWVIIASERAKRPSDFEFEPDVTPPLFDPFSPGNENKTPPEIAAYRQAGTLSNRPGWRVRVVPNKFPALQVEGTLNKRGDGIYDRMQGIGAHEVVIDAPQCVRSLTELTPLQVQEMLWMYRDRLVDLKRDKRLKYAMVFKNCGRSAGATLFHTHSQIMVTPSVPLAITQKLQSCQQFYDYRGRCLLCDMLTQEIEQKARVVMEGGLFLAFEPYAPRTPFETWIVPKAHESHFEDLSQQCAAELALVLRGTLARIEKGLGSVGYNYMLFTSPFDCSALPHFHWHMEILPRMTRLAGFEWGTGFHVNPVPPEDAAEFLRGLKAQA